MLELRGCGDLVFADAGRDPFHDSERFLLLCEVLVEEDDGFFLAERFRHPPQRLVGSDLVVLRSGSSAEVDDVAAPSRRRAKATRVCPLR